MSETNEPRIQNGEIAESFNDLHAKLLGGDALPPRPLLEPGHAKSKDARCLSCGFEMVGGRYVGLCPKCGSDRWYRARLNKQSPT